MQLIEMGNVVLQLSRPPILALSIFGSLQKNQYHTYLVTGHICRPTCTRTR